ncbi:MAG: YHYH domain-containing protein [Rubinisphaera brasiliensis]|uniref:YHYH domain-containing protein n=1 Tax=Rubinisphaera brasiliensis TaxID=119 RepID=UPI00391AA9F8
MARWLLLIAFAFGTPSLNVQAHPGGLDSSGGHHDRKNGGYHYHRGSGPISPQYDFSKPIAKPTSSGLKHRVEVSTSRTVDANVVLEAEKEPSEEELRRFHEDKFQGKSIHYYAKRFNKSAAPWAIVHHGPRGPKDLIVRINSSAWPSTPGDQLPEMEMESPVAPESPEELAEANAKGMRSIKLIQQHLVDTDPEAASRALERVVTLYPGTEAADLAQRILLRMK